MEKEYKIHVDNLPNGVTKEELKQVFQIYGDIFEAQIHTPGHGTNFGFVTYFDKKSRNAALSHQFFRTVRVTVTKARIPQFWRGGGTQGDRDGTQGGVQGIGRGVQSRGGGSSQNVFEALANKSED